MKKLLIFSLFMLICFPLQTDAAAKGKNRPTVAIITSKGTIVVELYPEKAPKTVSNFLRYVRSGFYDGTIFHRVIAGFMIQGGGFTKDFKSKDTGRPIINEAYNGLENLRGTIAMARTSFPHSATAQFFINVADNPFLDFKSKTKAGWGYCVFGKVVKGMDVVDNIAKAPVTVRRGLKNVPVEPVVIQKIQIVESNK